jgi:hypothetical protein
MSDLSRRLDKLTETAMPGGFTLRCTDRAGLAETNAEVAAEREAARRAGRPVPKFFVVLFDNIDLHDFDSEPVA